MRKPKEIIQELNELEDFFDSVVLPTGQIKLSQGETITNVRKFIDSHLNRVHANVGNATHEPFLDRLNKLKEILLTNK